MAAPARSTCVSGGRRKGRKRRRDAPAVGALALIDIAGRSSPDELIRLDTDSEIGRLGRT